MLRLITEFQPDILHLHLPNPSVLWTLTLPRARRIPWVVHWHSDIVTESQGWPMRVLYHLYRPLEQAVLHRARAIIVTSGDYLASSEPLQHWLAKCRVVPLGMDPGRLQIEGLHPRETAEQAPGLRVLAVGRLTYYKGLRYLIQAVAAVDTVRLDLVGDGDQATELKTLAARLGLQNRVTFHGLLDDQALARLIAGSDCLCLPSIERTEAFGMVLLEAMSFGRATVVSDVAGSGMGYVVDHGITGLKVQPKDAESLATAFRQLASDRTLLRKMGRAGKEKFENLFEINRAVAGVEDTYRVVLEDQAGNGEKAAWSR